MANVTIVTIQDYNYGNRLQNYAMEFILKKMGYNVYTLKLSNPLLNLKMNFFHILKAYIRRYTSLKRFYNFKKHKRFKKKNKKCFVEFNKLIRYSNFTINDKALCEFNDYYVAGSDQIWNPIYHPNQYINMLGFSKNKNKNISVSASFGIESITNKQRLEFEKYIYNFKAISCREYEGGYLLEKEFGLCSEILIDPTLILTLNDWINIEKAPVGFKNKKYILLYFLGDFDKIDREKVYEFSKERKIEIVDLTDINKNSYKVGPSEFIFLIHHAELIFTDSYHGLIFSYLFNKNIRVLDRNDKNMKSMGCRMKSLKKMLNLNDCIFVKSIENIDNIISSKISYDYECLSIQKENFLLFIHNQLPF